MAASSSGLQEGYSQEQWGCWKSHGKLLEEASKELSWDTAEEALRQLFKRFSRLDKGRMTREEFQELLRSYPESCDQHYHDVFFDLFDRNRDSLIDESDFLGGILAVSPKTPHKIDGASGQLRLQFIFLYYDQNRNGTFELEEITKLIEHLHQLRGNTTSDATKDAQQLLGVYPGPFGFKSFFDAAQKRCLNGTSQLLRMQSDLSDIAITEEEGKREGRLSQVQVLQGAAALAQGQVSQVAWKQVQNAHQGQISSNSLRREKDSPRNSNSPTAVVHGKPSVIDPGPFSPHGPHGTRPMTSNSLKGSSVELRVVRRLMEVSANLGATWRDPLVNLQEMTYLCDSIVPILKSEDSVVDVMLPCRVYGDIHGQLPDLLQFFNAFSWPDKRRGDIFSMNYIFLGDFVDRGKFSVDVITLLFSLKLLYPTKVYLVRGNHEDRTMNQNYGFLQDCLQRFNGPQDPETAGSPGYWIWDRVNDVFEFLPIAAVVENTILCIHGGIGDSISTIDDLRNIPKPIRVATEVNEHSSKTDKIVLDALWSDPTDNDAVLGVHLSPRGQNTCRFGPDRVQDFTKRNRLRLIIRAHECVQHGYEYFAGGQLLTVFSATNYCNQYNNDGAMVVLVKNEKNEVVEHAQVIKSGVVDTSFGWNEKQFREPSPIRRRF
eukprot:GEMP01011619.1.p1 GENE.GEMP01011619.1~~GEMP01011619.1.p1  ORF type:complete len:659 (+),score=95.45 GEMP01011619.1:50-2026(+)